MFRLPSEFDRLIASVKRMFHTENRFSWINEECQFHRVKLADKAAFNRVSDVQRLETL